MEFLRNSSHLPPTDASLLLSADRRVHFTRPHKLLTFAASSATCFIQFVCIENVVTVTLTHTHRVIEARLSIASTAPRTTERALTQTKKKNELQVETCPKFSVNFLAELTKLKLTTYSRDYASTCINISIIFAFEFPEAEK